MQLFKKFQEAALYQLIQLDLQLSLSGKTKEQKYIYSHNTSLYETIHAYTCAYIHIYKRQTSMCVCVCITVRLPCSKIPWNDFENS